MTNIAQEAVTMGMWVFSLIVFIAAILGLTSYEHAAAVIALMAVNMIGVNQ